MKVKKVILSLDPEYSLFGIKTNAPSYKLVYFLNKELQISFKRESGTPVKKSTPLSIKMLKNSDGLIGINQPQE